MEEAKCDRCDVAVTVTDASSAGNLFNLEYVMKAGSSLADLCPVMIQLKREGKPIVDDGCPHLAAAVNAKVYA